MTTRPGPGKGLSPRARGSRPRASGRERAEGSIPAGAGKPVAACVAADRGRVYPRGRGEAETNRIILERSQGLSPRARGSPTATGGHGVKLGSIPAGAGKPRQGVHRERAERVYPRGRGEARCTMPAGRMRWGLSPRARGSHDPVLVIDICPRSIPAGAGKPNEREQTVGPAGVYPRGRGEARDHVGGRPSCQGLSPRARGSLAGRCPR